MAVSQKSNLVSKFTSRTTLDFVLLFTPVVVVLVLTPFESIDRFNGPKLIAIAVMTTLAILLATKNQVTSLAKYGWFDLLLLSFVIVSVVALFTSDIDIQTQIFGKSGRDAGLLSYLLLILLLFLIRYVSHRNSLEIFVYSLIAVAIPVEIYALLQILNLDPFTWTSPESWIFSFLGNPNHLSSFLGIVFLLNIYLFGLRKMLIPALANMALIFTILVYNTSLQGFVIVFVGLWFLSLWKIKKRFLFISFAIAGVITVFLVSIYSLFDLNILPIEARFLQEGTFLRRKELWTVALLAAKASLMLGHGYSSFYTVHLKFRTPEIVGRVGTERNADSVHNEFLELLVNGGVFLFIIWLAIILVISWKLIKQLQFNRKRIDLNYDPLTFVGIVFFGAVIHNSISPMSVAISSLMMVAGGLILHYQNFPTHFSEEPETAEVNPSQNKTILLPVLAALGSFFFVLTLMPLVKNVQLANALNSGDLPKAYSAVSSFPTDIDRYLLLARALVNDEKYADARFVLEEASVVFPTQPTPIQRLLRFNLTELERTKYEIELRKLNPLHDYQRE
jgi:O-antigen ligase